MAAGKLKGSPLPNLGRAGAIAPDSFHVDTASHRQIRTFMFIIFQLRYYKESIIE